MILITLILIFSALTLWMPLLAALDFILCTRFLGEMIYEFYLTQIAPRIGTSINLRQFGEWALVTGATDGLGKGYVLALAAKGLNIVLVSRSEEKLKKVIAEVKEEFPDVEFRYVAHDFSKKSDDDVEKFRLSLHELYPKIGILVNNVGTVGIEFARNFGSIPHGLGAAYDVVEVNINSMLLMTSLLLPEFLGRRNGMIVNISSISAVHPAAGMAVYNGSKAFMDFFSRSIRQEAGKSNVLIQTVYPGFVKTNMVPTALKSQLPSFIAPDYEGYSKQCVDTIGALPETYGCLTHRLQAYLISALKCLPIRLSDKVVLKLSEMRMSMLEGESKKKKV